MAVVSMHSVASRTSDAVIPSEQPVTMLGRTNVADRRTVMASKEQQTMLSVRVPKELLSELEQVAVKEDRSVAAEVRRLIRHHVEAFREGLEGRVVA